MIKLMTRIKDYFKEILGDNDGKASSKRLITMVAFVLLSIAFLANIFWEIKLQEFIFDGMMYLVCVGLGVQQLKSSQKKRDYLKILSYIYIIKTIKNG